MTATPSPSPVAELRQRHQELARSNLATPISAEARQSFITQLIEAGAGIAPGRDRDAIRKLLYFWTAEAISRGDRPREQPLPVLRAYEGDGADSNSGSETVLTTASSSDAIDSAAATRAAIRIATLARQWRIDGENDGYLLTGQALEEASQHVGKDADTDAFVEASRTAELRRHRRSRYALWGLVAGLALGLAYFAYLTIELRATNRELQEINVKLKNARDEVDDAARRDTQRTRDEARGALDALREGGDRPLEPLKALLRRLGDAQLDELARLQYKPPDPSSATLGDRVVVAPDPGAPPQARPPATSPDTCTGVLWLGSEEAKLVTNPGKLSDLRSDVKVRVKDGVNIRLRRDMPTMPAYTMAPQVGLVPGGAELILTGEPKGFDRSNGEQFFVPVKAPREYCTRVFVQYAGERSLVDDVRAQLSKLSVQVSPAQKVEKAPSPPEVRYFWAKDKPLAERIAVELKPFNADKPLRVVPLLDYRTKPIEGTIEVWIELKS